MTNKESIALLGAICHDIQERSHLREVNNDLSKDDLTFCIDLLSRTLLAFIEERDIKNDSGMIHYCDVNIDAVCSRLFGRDYLSEEKRNELLTKWGSLVK